MNAKEFVNEFYLLRKNLLEDYFAGDSTLHVAQKIKALDLDDEKTEHLKYILNEAFCDAFYTILLGLDGEASIGKQQKSYKIYCDGAELTTSGEIEAYAYEYFQTDEHDAE